MSKASNLATVTKLKLIEFMDGLYFATIITSLFAVSRGIPLSQVVFAQGVYSLTIVLMEVPTGVVADKFGRKVSIGLGFITAIVGTVSFILAPSALLLYFMRFLQATGSALVSGANEALLYEASKSAGLDYRKQISILNSNGVIGLCIAGLVAAVFYQLFGEASFIPLLLASVGTQVIAAFLAFSIREEPDEDAEVSMVDKEAKTFKMLGDMFSIMRSNKTIYGLTLFTMLATCNEYFLYQTYAPFFKDVGVGNFWTGASFSLGLLLNFFLIRNVYKIERFLTLEKALALIKFGAAAGYIALAVVSQSTILVIILISTIGIFNIERPIISDFANQEIANKIRATVLSSMSLMSRITKAALTFIIGGIITTQPVTTGYLITGIYLVFGTLLGYYILVRCGCVRRVVHTANA